MNIQQIGSNLPHRSTSMYSPLDNNKYTSELDKISNSEEREPLEPKTILVSPSNTESMSEHPYKIKHHIPTNEGSLTTYILPSDSSRYLQAGTQHLENACKPQAAEIKGEVLNIHM